MSMLAPLKSSATENPLVERLITLYVDVLFKGLGSVPVVANLIFWFATNP